MPYKAAILTQKFLDYLTSCGVSRKTHKNYKSDLSHFSGWLILTARRWGVMANDFGEVIPFVNRKLASNYKAFLSKNNVATRTINRRLSTLRHLARFLVATQILDFDFMEGITNIQAKPKPGIYPLLPQFKKYLNREKVSDNTVKNYVNDVRQFLAWLESKTIQSQTNT